MSNVAPIGFERFPIPVNPIRLRRLRKPPLPELLLQTKPLAPVMATRSQYHLAARDALEKLYLLTAKTRRALLDIDPEHPLNGQHPTD